jgi:hypothetical protein
MPAIIVIAYNIVVLMALSLTANDFLKYSAWLLSTIFAVSIITWVSGKVFGKK